MRSSSSVWKSESLSMERWQSNLIKLIAITSMLADHIGVVFFPHDPIWRIAGRIAFPLFAYQLGVGYEHTSDRKKYALRLLLFALLSQIPYYFIWREWIPNIFFALLLGLGAISLYDGKKYGWLMLYLLASLAIEFVLPYDGGAYGVAMILMLYAPPTLAWQAAVVASITIIYSFSGSESYIQMFCLLALPVLWWIRHLHLPLQVEAGLSRINKWVFYAFYPLHLSALWALKALLT